MAEITEHERKIVSLFKPYIAAEPSESDRKNALDSAIMISISAHDIGKEDEIIEILENSEGVSFQNLLDIIFESDIFPPIEIAEEEPE